MYIIGGRTLVGRIPSIFLKENIAQATNKQFGGRFKILWQVLTPGVATEKVVRESGIYGCFDGRGATDYKSVAQSAPQTKSIHTEC
jgi:hypothetical protein